LALLQARLIDRHQFVQIGRHSSAITPCVSGVPQRSVLGPLLFTAYVSPVSNVIEDHGVSYHQLADDAQLYIAMNAAETASTLDRLARCTAAVKRWLLLNDLQLNSDKSEVVVFGTTAQLQSIASVKTVRYQ